MGFVWPKPSVVSLSALMPSFTSAPFTDSARRFERSRFLAASLFYTLFESAKLAGVDPHAYVLKATERAIASPGAVTLPEDLT